MLAVEFNPFFEPVTPLPPPILTTIRNQIARGCVSDRQGKRPLADRYDLRHGLVQPVNGELFRIAASISIADPQYSEARHWLHPLLTDADLHTAYAAHAVLLSHGARKVVMREEAAGIADDVRKAGTLANSIDANRSDLLFWQALLASRKGPGIEPLRLIREAIRLDPSFYNARLLELELLLARSRRHVSPSGAYCRKQAEAVLESTVTLFGLDTCPRHAVLLLNWLRTGRRDVEKDSFALLVRAYVAVLLNNSAAFDSAAQRVSDLSRSPCRQWILAKMRSLTPLLDKQAASTRQGP